MIRTTDLHLAHPINTSSRHWEAEDSQSWEYLKDAAVSHATDLLMIPEAFTQLSCLNLVRQYACRDEYDYSDLPAFQGSEETVFQRVDLCLNRLQFAFTCCSDTTPILKFLDAYGNRVGGDLRTMHYCRDFEGILRWSREHAIDDVSSLV
jgi:hypothetical protein